MSSAKQYNGNIQAVQYQVFGVDRQAYGYSYDNLDRMTSAQYGFLDNNNTLFYNSRYNETLTYDERGNITTLRRNGTSGTCIITNPNNPAQQLPVFSFAPIDNLKYTYNATNKNRLEKINETALTNYGFKVKIGVDQATAKYEYDKNGNLVKDPYKKIVGINYNHLNLPTIIIFQDDVSRQQISILYDAKGQKWSKKTEVFKKSNTVPVSWQLLNTNTYYYNNGIEYRNNSSMQPDIIQIDEGRLVWTTGMTVGTGSYKYEYAIRDHLGNTRVMVSDKNGNNKIDPSTEITQVNHYYPFGMNQDGPWLAGNNGDNKYQYNGKEMNSDFGLDWSDYGKRWYDTSIGRFVSVDGLAEKYPFNGMYNYAENRPVNGVDLDGLEWVHYNVGSTNVIDVNVSVNYYGNSISQNEFNNYMKIVRSEYTRILETSSGGFYTGQLSFNAENAYSEKSHVPWMTVGDFGKVNETGIYIAGQEGLGGSDIKLFDRNNNLQSPQEFALDFIHELMHTALLGHPFEITNASDCELVRCSDNRSFSTTNKTDSNIHDNIMMYNLTNLNGVSLSERWSQKQGDRLTPGQLDFLKNQVKMQMSGKGKSHNDTDYWINQYTGEDIKSEQ